MEYDNVENYCNETVSRCNHTLAVNSLYTPAYSLLLTKLNSIEGVVFDTYFHYSHQIRVISVPLIYYTLPKCNIYIFNWNIWNACSKNLYGTY